MLTGKLVDLIAGRKAELNCFDVVLTQRLVEIPIVISGYGCLYFDSSKNLRLKLYSTSLKSGDPAGLELFFGGEAGLIPESDYFSLVAVDVNGKKWCCERVYLNDSIDINPAGTVVDVVLNDIKSVTSLKASFPAEGDGALAVVCGSFRLPYCEYVERGDGARILSKLSMDIGGRRVVIEQKSDVLEIAFSHCSDSVSMDSVFSFLKGLSIAIGQLVEPSLVITRNGLQYECYVNGSVPLDTSTAAESVVDIFYGRSKGLVEFLEAYESRSRLENFHMHYYWRRLKDISSANTDAMALVLCVSIEGMVRNYFAKDWGDLDSEVVKGIELTRNFIKKSHESMPEEGRAAILNFLGNLKQKSVSAMLSSLVVAGLLDRGYVESWKELRHKLAHADNGVFESGNFESFVNNLQKCLALFGRLIELYVFNSARTVDSQSVTS